MILEHETSQAIEKAIQKAQAECASPAYAAMRAFIDNASVDDWDELDTLPRPKTPTTEESHTYYTVYYVDSRGSWRADSQRFGGADSAAFSTSHMLHWIVVKRTERVVIRGPTDKSQQERIRFNGCERSCDGSTASRSPLVHV